jgi:hypothetical protein
MGSPGDEVGTDTTRVTGVACNAAGAAQNVQMERRSVIGSASERTHEPRRCCGRQLQLDRRRPQGGQPLRCRRGQQARVSRVRTPGRCRRQGGQTPHGAPLPPSHEFAEVWSYVVDLVDPCAQQDTPCPLPCCLSRVGSHVDSLLAPATLAISHQKHTESHPFSRVQRQLDPHAVQVDVGARTCITVRDC